MPSPLSELVEGYQAGQEKKQKQAREIAQKTADEFERKFKTEQAQAQAAFTERRLKQEQQRIGIEQAAQIANADAKKATELHQQHMDKIAEERIKAQRDIAGMKIDFTDYSQKLKRRGQIYDNLIKQDVPPDMAEKGADQIVFDEIQAFEQRRNAQQGAGQPVGAGGDSVLSGMPNPLIGAGQQQPQQQTGNPIMDIWHQMHGHNVGEPSERPEFLNQATPAQQQRAQAALDKHEASKAITALHQANTMVAESLVSANKALKEMTTKKYAAEIDKVKAETDLVARKGAAEIARMIGAAHASNAQAQKYLSDMKYKAKEFSFDVEDRALKRQSTHDDALGKLRNQLNSNNTQKREIEGKLKDTVHEIARLSVMIQPGYLETIKDNKTGKPVYDRRAADIARSQIRPQLDEQVRTQQEMNLALSQTKAENANIDKALKETNSVRITHDDGAPSKKKNDAAIAADERHRKKMEQEAAAAQKRLTRPIHKQVEGGLSGGMSGVNTPPKRRIEKKSGRKQLKDFDGYKVYEGK